MAHYEKVYGKTPAGGDYYEIYFLDRNNNYADASEAFHCVIRECKSDGTLIQETWGLCGQAAGPAEKQPCPCCGKTLLGEYEICDVCNWENDPIQYEKPDRRGGANQMSLNEAIQAFREGRPVR